jgi:hypothetical protein
VDPLGRLLDVQRPGDKVDVLPSQPEQFAASHAREECQADEGSEG